MSIADFVYVQNGQVVIEDVKSEATKKLPVYRLKIHLMKHIHGLDVNEIWVKQTVKQPAELTRLNLKSSSAK